MNKQMVAQMLTNLIPLYAPLGVAGVRRLIPLVPGIALPGVAVVIGVVGEAVLSWIAGKSPDPIWGGALGAVGIAIRDTVDQFRKT